MVDILELMHYWNCKMMIIELIRKISSDFEIVSSRKLNQLFASASLYWRYLIIKYLVSNTEEKIYLWNTKENIYI